jgi:uncharacterized protein
MVSPARNVIIREELCMDGQMNKTFLIFFSPGPAWRAGKTSREQPYWREHAAFMDQIFEDGKVVLGGPYADYTRVLVIVEARDEEAVRALFAPDPFVFHEILHISSIHEWLIFLDARRKE